ncbi:hypothetical protein [Aromatoleum petrolei]|uniref:hypothetical protein n=1 Tax=Aromatoleum petrolei TaxID=76116 RepID=UPI00145D70FB|nr:hypothetical protein [Aromatoleum petrolei]
MIAAADTPQASAGRPCCIAVSSARTVHGRPLLAKRSLGDGSKVKIAPVHSDFRCETCSLSLMGCAGRRRDPLHALWVPRPASGFANHGLTCLAITT